MYYTCWEQTVISEIVPQVLRNCQSHPAARGQRETSGNCDIPAYLDIGMYLRHTIGGVLVRAYCAPEGQPFNFDMQPLPQEFW